MLDLLIRGQARIKSCLKTSDKRMPDSVFRWRALGRYYGFPECCVEAFIALPDVMPARVNSINEPWNKTGFVPCPACAPVAQDFEKFVREYIQPRRICSAPFPDDHTDLDAEMFVSQAFDEQVR